MRVERLRRYWPSRRFWVRFLPTVLAVSAILCGGLAVSFFARLTKVEPRPDLGFHWPYYLYVPKDVERIGKTGEEVHLMVLPNNTGHPTDDLRVHERAALKEMVAARIVFAQLDVAILIPVFIRRNTPLYTHALDRDCLTTDEPTLRRLDLQLEAMIDDATARLSERGWNVDPRVLLFGFSASGGFVTRFTVLHPERVRAVAAGGCNGWPIAPVPEWEGRSLRYPVGIADFKELVGKEFNADTYKSVPHLIFIGEEDTNDAVFAREAYDGEDRDLIVQLFGNTPVERWPVAEEIHQTAGCNADFRVYPGVGHRPPLTTFPEIVEFYSRALVEARE